ncbi:hypothetical protein H072_6086 [Dactylellina haptotyla CBS 200.50]|uniref:F-box domain-containing protein n=1 Tax=Dactylellina haptotyla (strain CBS 200.50) TaxID=1284197 RepID=S8BXR0_DACHA|nr:hypothetical protein H072_6086 [Dactylellina haptotyla CBS 200.50]
MAKRRRISDFSQDCNNTATTAKERGLKKRFFGKSHLLNLPQELVLRILHFLPVQSVLTVSRTSRKLHTLASDPQLWKSKFWARFIYPRIQRRAKLGLPELFSHHDSWTKESSLVSDWKKWLDDHTLIQEERALATPSGLSRDSGIRLRMAIKPTIKTPTLDWKAKFRLRTNWQRGTPRISNLRLLESLVQINTERPQAGLKPKGPPIVGCFYEGYFFAADLVHGVRVFNCGSSTTNNQTPLVERTSSLGNPTCIKVEESLVNDPSRRLYKTRGIDFVVGYHNGSAAILHFDQNSCQLSEKYTKRSFDDNGATELVAFYFPYLAIVTNQNQLKIISFHTSIKSIRNSDGATRLEFPPPDRPYLPSKVVTSLTVDRSWFPTCLSFRRDPSSDEIVASAVFSVRSIIVGSSITLQEFRLAPGFPGLLETYVVSPPLHDALDQAFFGRSAHMAFTTPTCVSYRHPFILTSHADNTLVLYNLYTDEDGKLEIQAGHQLWGHNTSVMAVEVGLRKAVSVDRRGEVRVWDLQGRYEKMHGRDKSVRVGGSGDPLFLNLDGKQGVQTERCLVGFGEEGIVVLDKVKDLDVSTTAFKLAIYDFT